MGKEMGRKFFCYTLVQEALELELWHQRLGRLLGSCHWDCVLRKQWDMIPNLLI